MHGVYGLSAAFCLAASLAFASSWEKLADCKLVPDEYKDGDSFHVVHKGKDIIFRLYFVDAPESDTSLQDRIAEQARYFDIPDVRINKLAHKAERLMTKTLQGKSFTVYTQWEDAQGSSQQPRYFAVVEAGDEDLAEVLVENGLARIYGASATLPNGTSIDTYFQRLRQLESRAKRKKLGAWGGSTADEEIEEVQLAEDGTIVEAEAPPVVEWPNVPVVAFLRAEAFINTERFEEAEDEMKALLQRFPEHAQRSRIEFYLALSIAMQERFEEAVQHWHAWLARYPNDIMVPEVQYWLPISLYYGSEYAKALPLFNQYAQDYPMSVYAPEAAYRAALCEYALEDFATSAQHLDSWLKQNPEHYFRWEATVTWGDALAALGELEAAKAAYLQACVPAAGSFYYMSLTQAIKVFKALGTEQDYRDMAAAFVRFIQDNPNSDNIIDAAYQAGFGLRQIKRVDEARNLYWTMLERYGNTPNWEGFELMLQDLAGMYANNRDEYIIELRSKYQKATDEKRQTLASRLAWAETQLAAPAEMWAEAQAFATRFGSGEALGPETLAWLGDTCFQNDKPIQGVPYLEKLLAAYPESRFAALAHTRLAEQKVREKKYQEALDHANVVLSLAAEPQLIMEASFARARSYEGLQRFHEAVMDYNTVLANRSAPRKLKPDALLGIGNCLAAQGKWREAIPYYQRVYVLYGAYGAAVAQAYLRSGKAFEELKDTTAAVQTYTEMLATEVVSGSAEAAEARQRLAKLGAL